MKKPKSAKRVVKIIAVVLLAYLSLGALLSSAFVSFVCIAAAAVFCLPGFFPAVERNRNIQLKPWHKYAAVLGVLFVGLCWIPGSKLPPNPSDAPPQLEEIRGIKSAEVQSDSGNMQQSKDAAQSKVVAPAMHSSSPAPGPASQQKLAPKPKATPKPNLPSAPAKAKAPAVKPKVVKPKTESHTCTYHGRQLYVGKRGGCYYYAGRSKEYVDRSYCSGCY
jgi:hypothetical protein